jgi:hypothetical protein
VAVEPRSRTSPWRPARPVIRLELLSFNRSGPFAHAVRVRAREQQGQAHASWQGQRRCRTGRGCETSIHSRLSPVSTVSKRERDSSPSLPDRQLSNAPLKFAGATTLPTDEWCLARRAVRRLPAPQLGDAGINDDHVFQRARADPAISDQAAGPPGHPMHRRRGVDRCDMEIRKRDTRGQ